jgi:hypothetical protein
MGRNGTVAVILAIIVVALLTMFVPTSGITEIAHESTQLHLGFFGSSIYEFHVATGRWPARIDDLAMTLLPQKSPYWKVMLDDQVDVIVWHKTLKPDPKDNARHILAYHNKGTISTGGQTWVCWGDLRTEYIKTDDLRAYLQTLDE